MVVVCIASDLDIAEYCGRVDRVFDHGYKQCWSEWGQRHGNVGPTRISDKRMLVRTVSVKQNVGNVNECPTYMSLLRMLKELLYQTLMNIRVLGPLTTCFRS